MAGTFTLADVQAGLVTYVHDGGETISDSVALSLTDAEGLAAAAAITLNITIEGENDDPVLVDENNGGAVIDATLALSQDEESTPVLFDFGAVDADGDTPLEFSLSGDDSDLFAINSEGELSFEAAPSFEDDQSVAEVNSYAVTVGVSDGNGGSDEVAVTVTVGDVNEAPVAVDDTAETDEDTASITGNVIADAPGADTDPDLVDDAPGSEDANPTDSAVDTLSVSEVNGDAGQIDVSVAGSNGGTFTIQSDGSYIFAPGADFDDLAQDDTRTTTVNYTVSDGEFTDTATLNVTVTGLNDAAVIAAITGTADEDADTAGLTFDLLDGATDVDGDDAAITLVAASVILTGSSLNGSADPVESLRAVTFSQNASGELVLDPGQFEDLDTDDSLVLSFDYQIQDSFGATTSNTATITINGANDAPVFTSGVAFTVDENVDAVTTVTATDDDDEIGTEVTFSITGGADQTQFEIDTATGALSFTGTSGQNFEDAADADTNSIYEVEVTANDGETTTTQSITVTVQDVNEAPTPVNDGPQVLIEGVTTFATFFIADLIDNDLDEDTSGTNGDLDEGSFALVSGDLLAGDDVVGMAAISGNAVVVTPDPDFFGTATFQYTVADQGDPALTGTGTVSVTVLNTPDAPIAVADTFEGNEDGLIVDGDDGGPVTGNVLDNDSDADGIESVSVIEVTFDGSEGPVTETVAETGDTVVSLENGQLTINANGDVSFAPNADFNGTETFDYTVEDETGTRSTATVTLTVNQVNDAPTADPVTAEVAEDGNPTVQIDVTGAIADIDTDPALNADPAAETFTFGFSTLGADGEVGGDDDTIGTVTETSDGLFEYDPNGQFEALSEGEEATDTFTYTVTDGGGETAEETVTVTITGENDAPIIDADSSDTEVTVDEDSSITGSILADDVDTNDALTFSVSAEDEPANGTVTINPGTGEYTYTPDENFNSNDSFVVTVSDRNDETALTDTITVSVTVEPVNDQPVFVDPPLAAVDVAENTTVVTSLDVSDEDGDVVTFSIVDPNPATEGDDAELFIVDQNGQVSFLEAPNFEALAGDTQFTITVQIDDDSGEVDDPLTPQNESATNTVDLTITVTNANDAPTVDEVLLSGAEGTPVTILIEDLGPVEGLLTQANADDEDGDTVSFVGIVVDSEVGGTADFQAGVGAIVFTPDEDFSGNATFEYTVTDDADPAATTTGTVTINFGNQPDAPVAVDDTIVTDEQVATTGNLLGNDSDPDGDDITLESVTTSSGTVTITGADTSVTLQTGSLLISPDGSITFTPNDEEVLSAATETFTYTISDATGLEGTGSVSITVNPVNDAPVPGDALSLSFNETDLAASQVLDLLAGATDAEENPLSVENVAVTVDGVAADPSLFSVDEAAGTLTLLAGAYESLAADEELILDVAFAVTDGQDPAMGNPATITVTGENDLPVAVEDAQSTDEDTPLNIAASGIAGQ